MKSLIPLSIRRSLGTRWDRWMIARKKRRLLHALRGRGTVCNVCQWEGAGFTDDCWHQGTICPQCRSQVRHRLLMAALAGLGGENLSEGELIANRAVLHFAPERRLRDRFLHRAARYVTADFARGDCDLLLDISVMPAVADGSFDTVIACDVLEHVLDDRAALREIHRILKPGGTAILTVPQRDPPAATDEDPTVTSEAGRIKRFGQKDHVRIYGDDFAQRFQEAGFTVFVLTADAFPQGIIARHVLRPRTKNTHPLATNERRIFFGRKS